MFAEIFSSDLVIVIVVVAVVIFGGSAIPKLARNLGSAKKEFEKGMKDAKAAKGDAKAADAKPQETHLAESKGENSLVLITDSDFINDGAAVQIQEIFGQRIVVPANGNLGFAQALLGLLCRGRLVNVAQISRHLLAPFP